MPSVIIHKIPVPYSMGDQMIEVYGLPDEARYEWRVISFGNVVRGTKNACYGNAEIALRDALIATSAEAANLWRDSHNDGDLVSPDY